ncbi:MAG: NADH-quinone oxidoreductase subunit J [Dehalococcoidia bacterium]
MELAAFVIIAGITILASIGVVTTRNIVYAALFLLGALLGVAGLFVLLFAEFLALVQIFIYGGAIIIVILFALMLTRTGEFQVETEHRRAPFAALSALALFGVLATVFVIEARTFSERPREGVSLESFGYNLFDSWIIPFMIAGFILLVALIGAVALARTADNGRQEDEPTRDDLTETPPTSTGGRGARTLTASRRRGGGARR